MDLDLRKRKYAYLLAKVGANVQPGQPVVVEAAVEGASFTPLFAEACYKLGASEVLIRYLDLPNLKTAALYRPAKDLQEPAEWELASYQTLLARGGCYVRLETENPALMADLSAAQAGAVFTHQDRLRNACRKICRENGKQWLIAMIPTQEWADYILPDVPAEERLTRLWDLVTGLCYVDDDRDPVATWAAARVRVHKIADTIDAWHFSRLHYRAGNGTALTVTLTPDSRFGWPPKDPDDDSLDFTPNMPTEEVCTTPEKYGTEGVVYATRPLVLGGKALEHFGFRFTKGRVTEVLAEDPEVKKQLADLIATDAGAGYLGECALVEYHSPISMSGIIYYTTLIDENASCHLALGRGLNSGAVSDPAFTYNDSAIHVDFMIGTPDMEIDGETADGARIPVFRAGDFCCPEFQG